MSFKRYEILLPTRYNDGGKVELEKYLLTNNDLARQFGAVSFSPETFRGVWIHEEKRYEDEKRPFVCGCGRHAGERRLFPGVQDEVERAFPAA